MNIKKTLSKVLACSLILASTMATGMPSMKVKAEEVKSGWNTLVLICPRVDTEKTQYSNAESTTMYDSEVTKVKNDAKHLEEIINIDSGSKANMKVDVKVSEVPINAIETSMGSGRTVVLDNILDKYVPQGQYDSVLVVYRNKDWSNNLGTSDTTVLPNKGHTNGAIVSTVRLEDTDHKMNYPDKLEPIYLMDRFADGVYEYLNNQGFKLDSPFFPPYVSGDEYQYCKAKRIFYRYYLMGLQYNSEGKGGITEEMWKHRPTNN